MQWASQSAENQQPFPWLFDKQLRGAELLLHTRERNVRSALRPPPVAEWELSNPAIFYLDMQLSHNIPTSIDSMD